MKTLVVDKKFNNKTLSLFLMNNFNGLNLNTIYKTLRKKDILINDNRINENIIVKENDVIKIYIKDDLLFKKINLDIIYEDENILIVNKPIKIEVLSNKENNYSLTSLIQNYSKEKGELLESNFPYPCHRIDMNTSRINIIC